MDANESQKGALELPEWVKLVNQLAKRKGLETARHPNDAKSDS